MSYPTRQVIRELNEANLAATQRFQNAGARLDNILVRNDEIGDQVMREALCTASYMQRDDPVSAQVGADASTRLAQTPGCRRSGSRHPASCCSPPTRGRSR